MTMLLERDRFAAQFDEREPRGWGGLWYGVMPAQVVSLEDDAGQNRIRVALPWSPDGVSGRYEAWARIATLFAGNARGSVFLPEKDDEVLVAFEQGDPKRPYVLGGLWNGVDPPPVKPGAANKEKMLKSRNGVTITLKDDAGKDELILETPSGQKVTLKDGPGEVLIEDSNGNSVNLQTSGITITAAAKVTVNAAQVNVSASQVNVSAAMSKFSGIVQADTVITNTIISSAYTPGAGNIW